MELIKRSDAANFKHFCNPGDLIASMASMKSFHRKTGRRVKVLQQLNLPANYYTNATHGTVSDHDNSTMVCMNKFIFDMIKPLVESQEYIECMDEFTGQEIDVDLDVIRKKIFVNIPHGMIQQWIFIAYPDLFYDLSKPWINLPDNDIPIVSWIKDKIIINFTERYRNGHINYFFLKKYERHLVFSGTRKEHLLFVNKWRLDVPYLETKDFLELAYAIKNCKFLLCNQSMMWNLSFSVKGKSVLEYCEYAANCQAFIGDDIYGFYHQTGLEYYVDLLMS